MDGDDITRVQVADTALAVTLELSASQWKVTLHDGLQEQPAVHTVNAPQVEARLLAVLALIEQRKQKWSLPSNEHVVVSYDANQDGFGILRALRPRGIECYLVDAASVPVQRHKRRAKTNRLDTIKLASTMRAWLRGDRIRLP